MVPHDSKSDLPLGLPIFKIMNATLCLEQNFPELMVAVLGNLRQIWCKMFETHLIGSDELRQ